MLQIERVRVIPQKSYHKILFLYPAIDNTFVFLGMKGLRQDCVVHMNKDGMVLFEYTFEKPMDSFGMISQDQAIMVQTRGNCITILNLKTHQFKRTPHHFFNQQSDQTNIITFADTKFLCLQEYGRYNDNRFKLSYYKYPLTLQTRPFVVYQAKDNQWTYQHNTKKANQKSLFCWFKPRHDNQWEFKTYKINQKQMKGQFNWYRFPQLIGIQYNMMTVEVALNSIWQIKQNQFMFVCISNKSQMEANKKLGIVQNVYICDVTTSNVREAQFSFGYHHDYLIDYYNIGRYCMFRTFDFQQGAALPSPVFYLDNSSQKIIHTQQWQCSYLNKYQFPGYDSNLMVQNLFQNADCQWFQCIKKKVINKKQIYTFFLLQLNETWDQDLLAEVINLIDMEQEDNVNVNNVKNDNNNGNWQQHMSESIDCQPKETQQGQQTQSIKQ